MNDEYVEEIHKIRENIYEHTKDMSSKELIEYYRNSSKGIHQRIEEYRSRRSAEITSDRREAVGTPNG